MTGFTAAITGIGLVTPAGIGVPRNWQRIVKGEPAAAVDPELVELPVKISCRVPGFSPQELGVPNDWQWDRYAQFALVATLEALRDAGLRSRTWADDCRVATIIGSGAGGTATLEAQHAELLARGPGNVSPLTLPMGLLNMAAGQVAIELGARGACLAPCTACASGATAIGIARDILRSGAADIVVAGGTEAPVTPLYVSAFARMRALSRRAEPETASRPFDVGRDGFVLGEGAAVFVMESEQHARARGARVRARVHGYGASADAFHVTSPDPDGRGALHAMRTALSDAALAPRDVGYVNAHGTSTPRNDRVESRAIRELFGDGVAVSSTKGVTGHPLGAAGAIEAAYTALALESSVIPPTAGLQQQDPEIDIDVVAREARACSLKFAISNSFGFGGQNACLLLGA
jgi:3-oxoacyl-[acyl-carrier-protein] synthase II